MNSVAGTNWMTVILYGNEDFSTGLGEVGDTPLHTAIKNNETDVAHLLRYMWDKNGGGNTPLAIAINLGRLPGGGYSSIRTILVPLLIETMFVKNRIGETPIYHLLKYDYYRNRSLLPARHIKNNRGLSAIDQIVFKEDIRRLKNYETTVELFSDIFPLSFLTLF